MYDIHLYDAVSVPLPVEETQECLGQADYLVFTSAGGVKRFLEQQNGIPPQAKCVCIGEVTASALTKHWDKTPILAKTTSVEGIAEAILAQEFN